MLKIFKLLLYVLLISGIIFLPGCSNHKTKNTEFLSSVIQDTSNKEENVVLTEQEAKEIGISVGTKNKQLLSAVSDIDEPAILVNGIAITNETICYQKALQLYPGIKPLKEEIVSIIRLKVVQSEAIKQKIKPSKEKVDTYLQGELDYLKNKNFGSEFELGYIEGMGITIEDYIKSREQLIYDMFQREDYWLWVQPTGNRKEEYIDNLVKKAEIEILDSEIKQLFD